ncbi:MAG TPA: hypothetical protein VMU26_07365 [Candidatus Polarisedimenticolia bacterium]|nr:hypothetical protein [Candidatus Polarisedimenticolia bacterium]
MKFTGICQFGKLWETVGMAKKIKVGDPVMWYGSFVTHTVTAIDASKKTADIKNPRDETIGIHRDVPWSELSVLDESQNPLRVGREATGDR